MRSEIERTTEISKLKELKLTIPPFNYFDDNHQSELDAQITVLTELYDSETIHEQQLDGIWSAVVCVKAVEAMEWLQGFRQQQPSEEWQKFAAGGKAKAATAR